MGASEGDDQAVDRKRPSNSYDAQTFMNEGFRYLINIIEITEELGPA